MVAKVTAGWYNPTPPFKTPKTKEKCNANDQPLEHRRNFRHPKHLWSNNQAIVSLLLAEPDQYKKTFIKAEDLWMNGFPRRILLVEDDEVLRSNYSELLIAHNFEVRSAATSHDAEMAFLEGNYDVIVLDVTLGANYEAGFELCHRFRFQDPTVPVIFLTERNEEHDKISGLRLGADDYLSKTISASYLVARINALIRRIEAWKASSHVEEPLQRSSVAGNRINIFDNTSEATWLGTSLRLTLTQFWILRDLVEHAGEVRTNEQLMTAAKITVQPNTITAHIKSIREAIRQLTPDFNCIKSERGRGYRWVDEL